MEQDNTIPAAPGLGRLDHLDGMRALAALYVVVTHAFALEYIDDLRPIPVHRWTDWLLYGHLSVDVFIVLSGFCLGLPVARRGLLPGGAMDFFRRRARRILPPFYAALGFTLFLLLRSPHLLLHPRDPAHALGPTLLSNALLLQDLFPVLNWMNNPFWSVAVEWKIYFLFPVFVWIGARWGWRVMLAASVLVWLAVTGLLHALRPAFVLDHTCPWYVFLFAVGVWAAQAAYGRETLKSLTVWKWLAGLSALASLLLLQFFPITPDVAIADYAPRLPGIDIAVGFCCAACLVLLAMSPSQGGIAAARRLLAAKPLVFLGTFAYSIYLIHRPLLDVAQVILFYHGSHFVSPALRLSPGWRFALMGATGVPAILAVSYVFFLFCERPFLNTRKRETMAETAQEAALSPAP